MEYYESINGFEIARARTEDVINMTDSGNTTKKEKKAETEVESDVDTGVIDVVWYGTIILTFVLWFVCFISLIANMFKKNNVKAGFSFIGILIPFAGMALAYFGKNMLENGESIGWALLIGAIVLELIITIISFAFWFSKRKNY